MTTQIGTGPDQIPINGFLGSLAFISSDAPIGGPLVLTQSAPTIASSATITPTKYVQFVSGTTTINTITVPTTILTTGGQIILIPSGLWSTGVSGNIALASTAILNQPLIMTYDAATAKWYPSYSTALWGA